MTREAVILSLRGFVILPCPGRNNRKATGEESTEIWNDYLIFRVVTVRGLLGCSGRDILAALFANTVHEILYVIMKSARGLSIRSYLTKGNAKSSACNMFSALQQQSI